MAANSRDKVYAVEEPVFNRLKGVEARLYAPEPLSGDERRDLANRLNALLALIKNQEIEVDDGRGIDT